MATIAGVDDIRTRWLGNDPLPGDEVIAAWLADAETLIHAEFPDLADRLAADPHGQLRRRVIYVEAQLTIQALKNPDGVRQRSQTAGEFTDSVTYGHETIDAAMTLTPAHRALLAGAAGRHVGIDMTVPAAAEHPLAGAWANGPGDLVPGGGPP